MTLLSLISIFLITLTTINEAQSTYESYEYQIIHPVTTCKDKDCNELTIEFDSNGAHNQLFFIKNYNHFPVSFITFASKIGIHIQLDCYYIQIDGSDSGPEMSTCDGELNGRFRDQNGINYEVRYEHDLGRTLLFETSSFDEAKRRERKDDLKTKPPVDNFRSDIQFQGSATPPLYVKLLLVHDFRLFSTQFQSNITNLLEDSKMLIVSANYYLKDLQVHLVIIGTEIWTSHERIELGVNLDDRLVKFEKYAVEHYYPRYKYDSAVLFTGYHFGTVLGIATLGGLCRKKGVVIQYPRYSNDTKRRDDFSAFSLTVAHEIGHTLGFEHIYENRTECVCPSDRIGRCVMHPYASAYSWSVCSKNILQSAIPAGLLDCTRNKPNDTIVSMAVLDNGVRELEEECDCDSKDTECWKCCQEYTSKLTSGSDCESGECCDKCKFKGRGKSCISPSVSPLCSKTSSTKCDGKSSFCPIPALKSDLTSCTDGASKGNCYQGQCISRRAHCRHLYGNIVQQAPDNAYDANTKGDQTGHCGTFDQNYPACDSKDTLCGQIKCSIRDSKSKEDELKWSVNKIGFNYLNATKAGQDDILSVTFKFVNQHLVPNGMSCGSKKICSNAQCVPSGCQDNCNNNGKCANGKCICDNGFEEPFCTAKKYTCPGDCNRHGFCVKDGVCECSEGFVPPTCTIQTIFPPTTVSPSTTVSKSTTASPPTTVSHTTTVSQPSTVRNPTTTPQVKTKSSSLTTEQRQSTKTEPAEDGFRNGVLITLTIVFVLLILGILVIGFIWSVKQRPRTNPRRRFPPRQPTNEPVPNAETEETKM